MNNKKISSDEANNGSWYIRHSWKNRIDCTPAHKMRYQHMGVEVYLSTPWKFISQNPMSTDIVKLFGNEGAEVTVEAQESDGAVVIHFFSNRNVCRNVDLLHPTSEAVTIDGKTYG
jgi:hypothetical protein